jgi:hypothetical protein
LKNSEKSTIISLLSNQIESYSGSIELNNSNIGNVK